MGATVYVLPKDDGEFPLIAIEEVLRRFVSKCVAKDARLEAQNYFGYLQVGVSTAHSAEGMAHVIRQYAARHRSPNVGLVW